MTWIVRAKRASLPSTTTKTNASIVHSFDDVLSPIKDILSPTDVVVVGLSPLYLKIILTLGLFILTIGVSLLPLKCLALARRGPASQRKTFHKVLSFVSCFAGGVFLGACFLDLFPDANETIEDAMEALGAETEFPVPEFVMISGLIVVLFTGQFVIKNQESGLGPAFGFGRGEPTPHGHSHGAPRRRTRTNGISLMEFVRESRVEEEGEGEDEVGEGEEGGYSDSPLPPRRVRAMSDALSTVFNDGRRVGAVDDTNDDKRAEMSTLGRGTVNDRSTTRTRTTTRDDGSSHAHAHTRHRHHGSSVDHDDLGKSPHPRLEQPKRDDDEMQISKDDDNKEPQHPSGDDSSFSVRVLTLLLALSLYSFFEGLALGLLNSNNDIINIFSALTIHKLVMGFSLGLNLVQCDLCTRTIVWSIAFFSGTSPIGALIGIALAEMYQTPMAQLVCGSLQAVACGTFLYVTFFEVLPLEMNAGGQGIQKVFCIMLGFALIAIMIAALPRA